MPPALQPQQKTITLEQYEALPEENRVEVFDGIVYDMASPSQIHQSMLLELGAMLNSYVKGKRGDCRVFPAPFDVKLSDHPLTIVQPDIMIVCDKSKLDGNYFMLLDNKNNKVDRKELILEVLEKVNLPDQRHVKIKNLSGGMKHRVGIAQALLSKPKVIIADEPTVGLDPEERMHLRKLLKELSKECVVILSTHIISDIEDCCDKIAILQKGSLAFQGTVDELKKQTHTEKGTLEEAYLCMTEEKDR